MALKKTFLGTFHSCKRLTKCAGSRKTSEQNTLKILYRHFVVVPTSPPAIAKIGENEALGGNDDGVGGGGRHTKEELPFRSIGLFHRV
jgi:hypothetical protein